jgi:3-methyl-2-oxobutanoate hydroxymethyltransferase
MFDRVPRFVRRFDELAARIGDAAQRYAAAVRDRSFPGEGELYLPTKKG